MSFDFSGDEHVNDIVQHFPIGIIPNPENVPYCEKVTFEATPPTCPPGSKLGTTTLNAHSDDLGIDLPPVTGDVYNLRVDPPYVGGLGFILLPGTPAATALAAPFTVRTGDSTIPELTDTLPDGDPDFNNPPLLPTDRDYGLTGISANVPTNVAGLLNIKITHIDYTLNGVVGGKPYISFSTGCLSGRARLEATSHEHPYPPASAKVTNFSDVGTTTGCNATHPPFNPTLPDPTLSTTQSDTPDRYGLKLKVPDEEVPEDAPAADPPLGTLHDSNLRRVQLNSRRAPHLAVGRQRARALQR